MAGVQSGLESTKALGLQLQSLPVGSCRPACAMACLLLGACGDSHPPSPNQQFLCTNPPLESWQKPRVLRKLHPFKSPLASKVVSPTILTAAASFLRCLGEVHSVGIISFEAGIILCRDGEAEAEGLILSDFSKLNPRADLFNTAAASKPLFPSAS